MKKPVLKLTISQNILAATLGIVIIILAVTGIIFYSTFSLRTDTLIEAQSREINKQIVFNYESYINSVIETANYIQYASLNRDAAEFQQELQDIYQINTELKQDVVSIFLFDAEGERILGNMIKPITADIIRDSDWYTLAVDENAIYHFSTGNRESLALHSEEQVIYVSRSVNYLDSGIRKNGVILIELNSQTITDLAGKTNLGPEGHILIIDDDDSLIYSSASISQSRSGESVSMAMKNYFGGFTAEIDKKLMYVNISPLSQTRWRIVTLIDTDEIARTKRQMLLILGIIFLGSVFITASVAIVISRRISGPMTALRRSMAKIEQGDFYSKVEVSGQKEVVHLASSFNNMIDTIRSLMQEVVSEQRGKRKTELLALQNQINPHFLYNTLDSIIWLAENDQTKDVITMVVALAKFFRISISRGENFIPVKDEIEHIRSYLTIQKIRYQEKFEFQFEIAPEIEQERVMKLILQPLVENAIYHGIGDEKEIITVRGYSEKDFLIFEIENTGLGITEDQIEEIYRILAGTHEITSVGLRNVYLRLKLYYGDSANVMITSLLDESTTVKLVIPLKLPEDRGVLR